MTPTPNANDAQQLLSIQKIIAANCFDLSPKFETNANLHNDWELVYVDSGEVICTVGCTSKKLSRGEIIFHAPLENHGISCNGIRSASIFSVIFECRSSLMCFFDKRSMRLPDEMNTLLKKLIDECNSAYKTSIYPLEKRQNAPFGSERLVSIYLEALLIHLMRSCNGLEDSSAERVQSEFSDFALIDSVCDYLNDNLEKKVTLNELTEKFHFGKSYLCEHFKRIKGISVMNYYLELKITEAKRLLREKDLPIHEISEKLGFESPEYFSRYFKSRVGHSPREFRRMLINESTLKKRI